LQSVDDGLLLAIQSFADGCLLDLHRQVLAHDFDYLFVARLETHRFIRLFVYSCLQLNHQHHVIIFENHGLSYRRDRLDAVADFVLGFKDGACDLLCFRKSKLGAARLHLHSLHENLVQVLFYLLAVAHKLGLHDEESQVLVLNEVLKLLKAGLDQVKRRLLLREQLEKIQEAANSIVIKCTTYRGCSDRAWTTKAGWVRTR